jgi:uncharacterized membrane protein YjfL (UPF0719 family)
MIYIVYFVVLALAALLILKQTFPAGPFCGAVLILVVLLIATGHCQTRVRQFPDKEILRRGNFIIAATTDGYLCYGTSEPLETSCHKAVPEVAYAGE